MSNPSQTKPTLLLTGATGFVGRNLLLAAIREQRFAKIYLPIRSLEKLRAQFLGDGFESIPDVVVPVVGAAHEWKIPEGLSVDHVVHCAGVLFDSKRANYFTVNVDGTLALLRSLGGKPKVILISSQAASGPCLPDQTAKRESDPNAPLTSYGESKLEMEKQVAEKFPHLDYLFLVPPMILGPRDQATLPLFKMVRQPLHFKPGFRPKYYSFISVGDFVGAIFSALEHSERWEALPQRRFFVASASVISDRDLLTTAAKVSRRRGVIFSVPQPFLKVVSRVVDSVPAWRNNVPTLSAERAKEIWPDRWVFSPEKFQNEFKWSTRDDLQTALRDTYDWYVKTGQLAT